jgi:hypothetical protein
MENPTLAEGASFGDIVGTETQQPEASSEATPEAGTEAVEGATDGSTTSEASPEVPGILKDDEGKEGGEDTPDLSIDPDLEKHPILKAKWEAFRAQKEKGIQQFLEKHNSEKSELSQFKDQYEPLVEFYQEFENPETVDAAFERMRETLEKTYGRPFGRENAPASDDSEGGDKSKYGLEFASDDKVVDTAAKILLPQIEKLLDSRLGPVSEDFKARQAEREASQKATKALPSLKAEFEVTAEPWVTPEKVLEAMKAYPGIDPRAAFAAHFVKEIARYTAKHAGGQQTVRSLPRNDIGAKTRADLKEGASFAEIVASEATL